MEKSVTVVVSVSVTVMNPPGVTGTMVICGGAAADVATNGVSFDGAGAA